MNYYELLLLKDDASIDEIKKSYRKLAMKYHPDRTNGNKVDEEKFKLINEAYATLSDPDKKRSYDFSLKNKSNHQNFNDEDFMNSFFRNSFDDIFESSFFKKQRSQTFKVSLDFWEAAFGVEKEYDISVKLNSGTKRVKMKINFEPGTNPGDIIEVNIDNHIINLQVHINDDLNFERDNLDLYTSINIPLTTAILGGKIEFTHWDKTFEINIPEGLEQNQIIRLSNMGIKKNLYVGDMYLKTNIKMPQKMTKKQKELLTEFDKIESKKETNSFNEYLKNLWSKVSRK